MNTFTAVDLLTWMLSWEPHFQGLSNHWRHYPAGMTAPVHMQVLWLQFFSSFHFSIGWLSFSHSFCDAAGTGGDSHGSWLHRYCRVDTAIDLGHLPFHFVSLWMSHFSCCWPDLLLWSSIVWWVQCESILILMSLSSFWLWERSVETCDFGGSWQGPVMWFWRSSSIFWGHFSHLYEKGSLDQWFL